MPTMGALHDGHLSLVRLGKQRADRCVASIFVNPKQFAAHEDLGTYPRREDEDLKMLADAGCDLVFLPQPAEMYPDGFATSVRIEGLSEPLDGQSRPHFFGGVATVVTKLLNQVRADIAIFGEKDYQQLLIIRRLNADLDIGTEIIGGPIVREEDGLAMSSRNAYLSSVERRIAGQLNKVLRQTALKIAQGGDVLGSIEDGHALLKHAGFSTIDYLEARSGKDLTLLGPGKLTPEDQEHARVFVAAMLGRTRLIDNMKVTDV
ncbi:pantothenate synthetase [Aquisalinus flavus]|uniref:Pantothenate synthetase n=1 Tax=Aquisalinus flavus TaxID=1526572 RepID=A0A8J2V6K7_9PROT|nr:pantothenate synthetase [Aquisalinus flavus]